jgi:hypothetical protein
VGECLREVAQVLPVLAKLLRVQLQMIRIRQHLLKHCVRTSFVKEDPKNVQRTEASFLQVLWSVHTGLGEGFHGLQQRAGRSGIQVSEFLLTQNVQMEKVPSSVAAIPSATRNDALRPLGARSEWIEDYPPCASRCSERQGCSTPSRLRMRKQ